MRPGVAAWLAGGLLGLGLAAAFLAPCLLNGLVPARGDLADFFWPMKSYTASRWTGGAVPLWNPLSGCGEPWLAQLQTGVFYPPDLLFLLRWPFGPFAAIAFHLAIAASGLAAWLDDLGASRAAALAGATIFVAGGPFLSLVPVFNNACTAAFLPFVFLGARRASRGGTAGFAFASALAFLGGEPALAIAGILAAAALALATRGEGETAPREKASRCALRLAGGLVLAAGLVAVTALPFAELIVRSGRLTGATREEALARPVGAGDLADLVLPPAAAMTREARADRGGYLATLALGPLVLVLAGGCAAGFPGRRRLLLGLSIAGAVGLLLSLGERGLLTPLFFASGLFGGLRFPARWFLFPHLVLALAAGAGLDGWLFGRFRAGTGDEKGPLEEIEARSARRVALLSAAAGLGLLAVSLLHVAGRDPVRSAAVFTAALAGAGLLVVNRRRRIPFAGGAVVCLLAGSLVFVAGDPLEGAPSRDLHGRPRVVGDLAPGAPGRVFAAVSDSSLLSAWTLADGRWSPETPRRARAALAGYDNLDAGLAAARSASPIPDGRMARLLGAALVGGEPATILGLADVRYCVTPFGASIPGARLVRRADGVSRYDLDRAAGRVFFAREGKVAGDEAVFTAIRGRDFDPESVAYLAEAPGLLPPARERRGFSVARVVADLPEETEVATASSEAGILVVTRTWDPGWEAEVDGAPTRLVRADLAFQALVVPAGEHRVVLRYRPVTFRAGAVLSGISVLALVGLALAGTPRPR